MDPRTGPDTGGLSAAVHPQQIALVTARLLEHLHELDSCDLPVPSGRTEPIVTVAEVRSWLEGIAARARGGERL